MTPRISCIMPTADRRRFVPGAIAAFLAQTRDDAELLILDDGADAVGDLIPPHPRIRYRRDTVRRTTGDKRNRLCSEAAGSVIVHWDDDDWQAADRLDRQMAALDQSGAAIVGLDRVAFLADDGSAAWDYVWRGAGRWVCGSSLAYRRRWWEGHPFPPLRVGEDTRFVLDAGGCHVHAMPPADWLIARVHSGNTSPKQTHGGYWHPRDPAALRAVARSMEHAPAAAPRRIANVHAVLAHESPECVIDLVRNLRFHDPDSPVLLYDGSPRGDLLDPRLPWARWGVEIVANPRPMRWGKLHGFALACVAHLGTRDYDLVTIVDSDQLMLRPGYTRAIETTLGGGVRTALLSSDPRPQGTDATQPPCRAAQAERELWRPFLQRFPDGEASFTRWSFWPATAIGADVARDILRLFDDPQLQGILAASRMWATEEVLFPTLAALLGHRVIANPTRLDWVAYRRGWTLAECDRALAEPWAFWMHPVPRVLDHPLRNRLRERANHYRTAPPAPVPRAAPSLIATMRTIEGWLDEDEGELLLDTARKAARNGGTLIEIGCHYGRASFLLANAAREGGGRLVAIDHFDGIVGARDGTIVHGPPQRARFDAMLATHGLTATVDVRTGEAADVSVAEPIAFLLVDGLHDYAAAASDFHAMADQLAPGARVAFHDYADHFPGVTAFVDELAGDGWMVEAAAGTLRILTRPQPDAALAVASVTCFA